MIRQPVVELQRRRARDFQRREHLHWYICRASIAVGYVHLVKCGVVQEYKSIHLLSCPSNMRVVSNCSTAGRLPRDTHPRASAFHSSQRMADGTQYGTPTPDFALITNTDHRTEAYFPMPHVHALASTLHATKTCSETPVSPSRRLSMEQVHRRSGDKVSLAYRAIFLVSYSSTAMGLVEF